MSNYHFPVENNLLNTFKKRSLEFLLHNVILLSLQNVELLKRYLKFTESGIRKSSVTGFIFKKVAGKTPANLVI